MLLFRHNAGPASCQAIINRDPLSSSATVKGEILALARLGARISSANELFVRKESRGCGLQKDYTAAFAKFLLMVTKELIGFFRQLAHY